MNIDTTALIKELNELMWSEWTKVIKTNSFVQALMTGKGDLGLFGLYLTQVYHLTRHNPVNQAMVCKNLLGSDFYSVADKVKYMKFCFHHAEEEVGHEYMALHDLKALGVSVPESEMPAPLEGTRRFIKEIYTIAETAHPAARLGYSFWAEGCYEIFKPFAEGVKKSLGLTNASTTFLNQHGAIDKEHFEEIKEVLGYAVNSERALQEVKDTLIKTVQMTGDLLNDVFAEYEKIKAVQSPYSFMRK